MTSQPDVDYPKAILLYWDNPGLDPDLVKEFPTIEKAIAECQGYDIDDLYESYDPERGQFMGIYVPVMILVPKERKVDLVKYKV